MKNLLKKALLFSVTALSIGVKEAHPLNLNQTSVELSARLMRAETPREFVFTCTYRLAS